MPAHFSTIIPVLVVDDVGPTRRFFVDRLGFTVRTEVDDDGTIGLSIVERAAVTIMIRSDANLRQDAGENYVTGPYKASVYIVTDNIELLVPQIIDADVVLPLRKTAQGVHEIGIREPGGNVVTFASRLPN